MKREIAIIGGGASGFLTAITAKKNGKDVIILERKERVLLDKCECFKSKLFWN